MAADNSKSTVESLEDEFVAAVCKDTGFQPSLARIIVKPIIQHLVDTYAGERFYVPAPRRQHPIDEIRKALEATGNPAAVCERFHISRATMYRLLSQDSGQSDAVATT